jgi:hypothetical protein
MNEKYIKELAKIITVHGYRNSFIETIHAGKTLPKKYQGDEWSKISNEQMKQLNIEICNQIYTLLYMIEQGSLPAYFTYPGWTSDWYEPQLIESFFISDKL